MLSTSRAHCVTSIRLIICCSASVAADGFATSNSVVAQHIPAPLPTAIDSNMWHTMTTSVACLDPILARNICFPPTHRRRAMQVIAERRPQSNWTSKPVLM